MATFSIRIDVKEGRLGPGKVRLLELIAELGTISAASRAMNMSYKRAWDLVAETNAIFGAPVVEAQAGGSAGGGARVTALGRQIVQRYRLIEEEAAKAAMLHLEAIDQPQAS